MSRLLRSGLKAFALLLVLSIAIHSAHAAIDALHFQNEAQEKRYRHLATQLRCLVCQNQSLADSNADLARDLRVELLEQIQQNKSDQEIIDFLVARYGNFVRYDPPFDPETWLLWLGPFLMFLIALYGGYRIVRSRAHSQPVEPISPDEAQRLQDLLNQSKKDQE
jgi:cytochrome c-type biogenesis protein CcmH